MSIFKNVYEYFLKTSGSTTIRDFTNYRLNQTAEVIKGVENRGVRM